MYFPSIGDEVTMKEIETYSAVTTEYDGQQVPAWEIDAVANSDRIGGGMWLIYREHNAETDTFFSAEAYCCKVADGAWAVVDMVNGYPSLDCYDKDRQDYKVSCIQAIMDKHNSGLDARAWLEDHAVL